MRGVALLFGCLMLLKMPDVSKLKSSFFLCFSHILNVGSLGSLLTKFLFFYFQLHTFFSCCLNLNNIYQLSMLETQFYQFINVTLNFPFKDLHKSWFQRLFRLYQNQPIQIPLFLMTLIREKCHYRVRSRKFHK